MIMSFYFLFLDISKFKDIFSQKGKNYIFRYPLRDMNGRFIYNLYNSLFKEYCAQKMKYFKWV